MILAWLLRLLLVILLVRAIWRLLAGVVEGWGLRRPSDGSPGSGVALVRDPVCGTYVVPSRAITSGRGASLQHFCSARCRDQYAAGRRLAS